MNMGEPADQQAVFSYLLNELSEEQVIRFEERCFSDPSLFLVVSAIEDELIEEYVRGSLSPERRVRFEQHYLATAARRDRVDFTRDLLKTFAPASSTAVGSQSPAFAESPHSQRRPFWSALITAIAQPRVAFASAVAGAMLIIAVSWFFLENRSLRARVAVLEGQQQDLELHRQEREQELSAEDARQAVITDELAALRNQVARLRAENHRLSIEPDSPDEPDSRIARLFLSGDLARNLGDVPELYLSPAATAVEMVVSAPDDSIRYAMVLQTVSNRNEIWRSDNVRPRMTRSGPTLTARLPAEKLKKNGIKDYVLIVTPVNETSDTAVAKYYVHVTGG